MINSQCIHHLLSGVSKDLQEKLEDITNNIEFDDELCVRHPDYQLWETSLEIKNRFHKLPLEVQQKHIARHLRSFLYGIYYNGSLLKSLKLKADFEDSVNQQNLKNDSLIGIDVGLFQQLHESNQGQGYFDPGWLVRKMEVDGSVAVTKGKLTVHINPELHLMASQTSVNVGEVVSIKMPKNCLQEGFYIAVGNTGIIPIDVIENKYTIVRIYFNIISEGAVQIMKSLTQQLNENEIFFSFKASYSYSGYERYDAGVLYIKRDDYPLVHSILQNIYLVNQDYFRNNIPLFTKYLAPGLGLAEEPDIKFDHYESFGTNRCQIVANGLLEAKIKNQRSPEEKLNAIINQFSQLNIDLQYPYLNSDYTDIYTPLSGT
ncbi:hypothetical protein FD723_20355 [Nostoc sp. C052]|uniref:T3SS effector HopA1 family protein n=1 Tax=Nostoc sp. C052 TaxID=2576902 RepID=UPI0015C31C38|nr:T3SS effector HopA1 family protein [Nostoc sp. C052]QLE42550.1 hypothetical protein FD723_20355 [Nostoc sp. C052]